MTAKIDDIISNLRAIIISSKGGLKLSDIRADYKEAFGADIPLNSLGYTSLDDFLKKNTKNFTVAGNTVHAVTKSSSLHIVSLINRQSSKSRGRSKLSSKQARNLRKPAGFPYGSANANGKKGVQNASARFLRQNNNKTHVSSASKQASESQRMIGIKKTAFTAQKSPPDPRNEHVRSTNQPVIQSQVKNVEGLKNITRTVVNHPPSNIQGSSVKASTSQSCYKLSETMTQKSATSEAIPFEDFEDLHISVKQQSRLLKIKNMTEKKINTTASESVGNLGEDVGPPPESPFRRSLANTSQEAILTAKRTAHLLMDNNNVYHTAEKANPVEMTINSEENIMYEQKLKQFCIDKGLMLPVYCIIMRKPPNQPKCFGCKLSIGLSFFVSTYPVETHSEITARELASKKAYNILTADENLLFDLLDAEYVVKLRKFCDQKKLPEPIFKSIECRPKNELGYYICKVRIGEDILLSSYPEELQDEFVAKNVAAKKALDYLSCRNISSLEVSKDDKLTITQIYDIIKEKDYGVWSSKLPILFLEKFKKDLPMNWFSLIQNSPKFRLEHIEKVGYILKANTETCFNENAEENVTLATLKVPESNQWEVYITNVVTSAEVWCRLIGKEYSELYDSMMTRLELQPPTLNVQKPAVGKVYLVNIEESWNRVKVLEIFWEKQEATVFLIDIGLEEVVKLSQLFYLQKNFFSVPPQAILLSLNELDCLAECEELQSALFHCLLGNSFIAEVVAILDEGGNVSSVILWDTSTEDDVNVNLKLIDNVIKTIKSPSLPSVLNLAPLGLVSEMFVSHVDDNGDIYLQSSQKNAKYVDWIISVKLRNSGNLVTVHNNKIDPKKLYVTRCNRQGLFYRVKLSKVVDATSVIVKLIDFGCEQEVPIDDLYDLEQTSIDLATVPAQVICSKFANLKVVNSKIIAKIREYVLEQNVLVKVIPVNVIAPSTVELFKRSQTDGTLSSVNNKIINDKELLVVEAPTRKKSYVVGLETTLSRDLPMPFIPPIGSFFNVIVTLAAHPGLFSVQPLTSQSQLMELMFRLQEKCETSYSKPLAPVDFKIGKLYAVKHADGYWYRAYAHAFVSPSTYTVILCDFGDFVIVPGDRLMPLSSEFKTFPYQAIRAYLAGISPVDKDWSAVDCVKFREMVIEKNFVSQVVEINRDAQNPNYITLGLILVDTTTAEDVYIHQILIENNIAVLKV